MSDISLYNHCVRKINLAGSIMIFFLAGYFIIFLHIGWLSNGGTGVDLPYNLLAWSTTAGVCAIVWFIFPSSFRLMLTPLVLLLFIGAALMSLPLLWSPTSVAFYNALPRIAGLWAGMVFLLSVRQLSFTERHKRIFLYALVSAGTTEAVIVLFELYGPKPWLPLIWQQLIEKYGRSGVGVFQQVNVTSSFLAMALTLCLFLFASRKASLRNIRLERIRLAVLAGASILLSSVITLIYSRIGWLGGTIAIIGTFITLTYGRFRHESRYQLWILLLPITGVLLGYNLMHYSIGEALAVHDGSNRQRILTLYQTLIYSTHHPIIGYGAGTYEGYYQAFMAKLQDGNASRELMDHPHNELLYQYAEGGIIALAGLLLCYSLYILLWLKAKTFMQVVALMAMLPILLHTQVEYPLYYSVPHWIVLLMLIRLAEGDRKSYPVFKNRRYSPPVIKPALFLLALYGSAVSLQAFENGKVLNKFENNEYAGSKEISGLHISWIQHLRYEQDLNLSLLLDFQHNHDQDYLKKFLNDNMIFITIHPWPELYSNEIAVFNYLHEYHQANEWLKQAHYTLPWEKQFIL